MILSYAVRVATLMQRIHSSKSLCLFIFWRWRRPGRLLLVPIPWPTANIRLIVAKVTKLSRKVDNANGMKKAAVCL